MPQFYSLEEAARVLGLSPEELKEKAQQRQIRAFMDSGSWRFRVADIDEEARRRGIGSDPELSLSDLELVAQNEPSSDEADLDFNLTEFQLGVASPDPESRQPVADDQEGVDSDADILLDDLTAPPPQPGSSSSTIIGMGTPKGKLPSDSDVRLLPDYAETKQPSDSDVRLGANAPSDSDVTLFADEDGSAEVPKLPPKRQIEEPEEDVNATLLRPSSPPIGSSAELETITEDESESDFELTPSSVIDALEPESGSDFELTPLDASSDEFETTPLRGPSDSDVTGVEPSASGINLGRPSDSGINLQSVGGFNIDSAESIELAPLEDEDLPPQRPTPKPAPASAQEDIDLSATALPVRTEKDIFEDTDFEVDALDSGNEDRTVQLEAQSDFDLEDSDSASEVFAIDEEDVDENAATALGPAVLDEDEEEMDVSDAAMEEAESGAWDVEDAAATPSQASRVTPSIAMAGGAQPEWGGLWVSLLGVATVLMMLLAFVGLDVVRNLYEFRGAGPASGLVKMLAGLMG